MALFFGGNPFATPVGKKIEQATDGALTSENWALNMEICDLINETDDASVDAIKAIKKRLNQNANRNFTTIMYTLTVLETCVKNCQQKFLILVCNKEFIQDIVKLIGPKNDPPIALQQKILSLIQAWAEAFKNQSELCGVCQVYNELKQKGIEFPQTELNTSTSIYSHNRISLEDTPAVSPIQSFSAKESNSSQVLNADQISKLSSELRVVEGNMMVLNEMLGELVPGKELPSDLELLKELYTTCQAMQERLVDLINQLSNDEITGELLRVNDGLNNLFLRYSRYEKNRKSYFNKKEKEEEGALIDFGVNETSDMNSVSFQVSNLTLNENILSNEHNLMPSVTAHNSKDEFEAFARSRKQNSHPSQVESFLSKNFEEVASCESNLVNNLPKGPINMHTEQDFDEMAAWLGEKQEESLTSSEFEKFLAERAAAAEALPSSENNDVANSSSKKKNKDTMLAL